MASSTTTTSNTLILAGSVGIAQTQRSANTSKQAAHSAILAHHRVRPRAVVLPADAARRTCTFTPALVNEARLNSGGLRRPPHLSAGRDMTSQVKSPA